MILEDDSLLVSFSGGKTITHDYLDLKHVDLDIFTFGLPLGRCRSDGHANTEKLNTF